MAVNWFQIGTLSSLVLFALLFFGEGSLADVGDEVNKVGDSIKNAGDKIKDVTIKEVRF
jgi:hypothetical protein